MTTGASWPWNLSTVPTRGSPSAADRAGDLRDLGVVGGDDEDVVERRSRVTPFRSVQRPRRAALSIASRDALRLLARRLGCRRGSTGDVPETRAADRPPDADALASASPARLEPALVERLGDEGADVGVEASACGEEQAAVGGHVRGIAEQVLERRRLGAVRVAALRTCGSCCGSPSRTIDAGRPRTATTSASDIWPASSTNRTSSASAMSVRAHSQARAGDDVERAGARAGEARRSRTRRLGRAVAARRRPRRRALRDPDLGAGLGRGLRPPRRRDSRSPCARRGDPDTLPVTHELHDHPRAGVRLAGAGRALDREDAGVQPEADGARVDDVLARPGPAARHRGRRRPDGRRRSSSRTARYGPGPSIPASSTWSRDPAEGLALSFVSIGTSGMSAGGCDPWRDLRRAHGAGRSCRSTRRSRGGAAALPGRRIDGLSPTFSLYSCAASNR